MEKDIAMQKDESLYKRCVCDIKKKNRIAANILYEG